MLLMVPAHRPFEVDGIPRLGRRPDRLTSGPLQRGPKRRFRTPKLLYRGRFPEDCGPPPKYSDPSSVGDGLRLVLHIFPVNENTAI